MVKPLLVIRFALRVIRFFFTPPGDPRAALPFPVIRFLSAALVVIRSQKWPFDVPTSFIFGSPSKLGRRLMA